MKKQTWERTVFIWAGWIGPLLVDIHLGPGWPFLFYRTLGGWSTSFGIGSLSIAFKYRVVELQRQAAAGEPLR